MADPDAEIYRSQPGLGEILLPESVTRISRSARAGSGVGGLSEDQRGSSPDRVEHDVRIGCCPSSSSCGGWFGPVGGRGTSRCRTWGGTKHWLGGAAEMAPTMGAMSK